MHRKSPEEESLLSSLISLFCVYENSLSGYGVRAKLKDWNIEAYLSVSPATIYRSLGKLEDMGLLTSKVEKNGRYPASRVYSITTAGKRRYREMMKRIASFKRSPHALTPLIGLGSFLTPAQRMGFCRDWIRDAQAKCRELDEKLKDFTEGGTYGKPFAEWLMIDHELAQLKTDIRWLQKYADLIVSGKA